LFDCVSLLVLCQELLSLPTRRSSDLVRRLVGRRGRFGGRGRAHGVAASTTLANNMARVMGPTPPGLGDTHPATSRTSGATSPTMRDFPVTGSTSLLTPTS